MSVNSEEVIPVYNVRLMSGSRAETNKLIREGWGIDVTRGGEIPEVTIQLGEQEVKLKLYDDASAGGYGSYQASIILCDDIRNLESLKNVQAKTEENENTGLQGKPQIVLGTNQGVGSQNSVYDASEFADNKEMQCFQTSAQDAASIKTPFEVIAKQIYEKDPRYAQQRIAQSAPTPTPTPTPTPNPTPTPKPTKTKRRLRVRVRDKISKK